MRALCEAVDLNVSYNSATNTASITTPDNDSSNTAYITTEKAKEIALDTSGVSALNAKFTKCALKLQNGQMIYDVSFTSGTKTYYYTIDAKTGKVLSSKTEDSSTTPTTPDGYISQEKAKEIAFDTAGVSATNATFTKCKLERDDGRAIYEIKFRDGKTELRIRD